MAFGCGGTFPKAFPVEERFFSDGQPCIAFIDKGALSLGEVKEDPNGSEV
jgi:hypothetical protein